jgi:hypothetical protein
VRIGRECAKNDIVRHRPCIQHGVQMHLMAIKDDDRSCIGTDFVAPGCDGGRDNGAKRVPKKLATHKCFRTAKATSFVEVSVSSDFSGINWLVDDDRALKKPERRR